jgi:hypothetical protein
MHLEAVARSEPRRTRRFRNLRHFGERLGLLCHESVMMSRITS